MIAPTLNMNGTSRQSLLEQYQVVMHACDVLSVALAQATPHGRDYQTAPDGNYGTAAMEHRIRQAAVRKIHDDMQEIAYNVARQ